ncbi:MAG: protoporphyrinogen oxidase [Pirellulales bacterium]|nr:protoporphyrinogen oxidase [Pirellulales bacterium]
MLQRQQHPRSVAVIGGGIAGLAAAHRLTELDRKCSTTLFEAGPRAGGVLSTLHEDGFQVEQSADNFITTIPWGLELCRRLGLEDRLARTNPANRRTFVVRRGRMHPLPDGFLMMAPARLWPLAVTGILGPWGKIRAACEYFIPPRGDQSDESMAAFVRRRLGREAYERLVEPLVGAVYAADLEKLSVLATLPRFRDMEREHGSLIRAMRRAMHGRANAGRESGARYGMFVTLRDGLSSLVEALVSRLPDNAMKLNCPVIRIERHADNWRVTSQPSVKADHTPHRNFDAIILATPSHVTAKLLEPLDALLAERLASIAHSGTAVVSLGYDSNRIGHPLDGMGVVVPAVERSPILACSFSSRKYPHRAPAGKELLRVFVGGARRPELVDMNDDRLLSMVLDDVSRLLQIRGGPCFCRIARWPATMPQYRVGHRELVAEIESRAAAWPNLQLAGNAYRGVGIPDCIHGGKLAAERIINLSE